MGELEGSLEAKDIELKESAALVDRVKALHSDQCHELQRQIEEVWKKANSLFRALRDIQKNGCEAYLVIFNVYKK